MPRKIADPKKGVRVHLNGDNAQKLIKITEKSRRTVAAEANEAVRIYKFVDNGR